MAVDVEQLGLRFPGKDRAWFARTRVRGDDEETLLIERDGALVLVNSLRVPKESEPTNPGALP